MSALDIGARGIARAAREAIERMDENGISISKRNDLTAVALAELAAENPLLTCAAGEQYTVDIIPYIQSDRLIIRGNGAEIRNVNATPLNVEHNLSSMLPLGVSIVWDTPLLTYFAVAAASGPALTLPAGAGANFAPGDLVVLHGASAYPGPGNEYEVYRNYLRGRVVEVAGDTVVIDRAPPAQLLADSPVIGNTADAHETGLPGNPPFYLLYAPHISHLTLASDLGNTLRFGGVIDGTFRDLTLHGRDAITMNAMQDCLFENIRFKAWRVMCELAEGSYGTVVRNMRGTLSDASTRFGGAPDTAPFFIAIGESSAECVLDDLAVDSGPNDATGAGVIFGSGRNNEMRNSRLRFPALTVPAISIQTVAAAGHPNADCGFRDLTVTAPICAQFFVCSDGGAGIVRPYLEGSRFLGAPTVRAATLRGFEGRFCDNFFENGDIQLDNSTVGCRIEGNTINGSMVLLGGTGNVVRGNYIRDGFGGLSNNCLKTNTVADNESDASRRLAAAAHISALNSSVTTTTANAAYASATFAAGDLKPGDKIFVRSAANTGSTGSTHTKSARVSVTSNQTTTGAGSRAVTSASTAYDVDTVIEVITNTFLSCVTRIGDTTTASGSIIISSLNTHGLTVNLEYWTSNSAEGIVVRSARIVAVKPGMSHPPID